MRRGLFACLLVLASACGDNRVQPPADAGADAMPDAPADAPPGPQVISGTVNGLAGRRLVLQDDGGDDLAIVANGAFTFATPIASGGTYAVTVRARPAFPTQT